MTAYIEYVFLENFLLDGLLLLGACRVTKTRVRYGALAMAGAVGGGYSLLSPFIRLPMLLTTLLKFCVGACLCLLVYGRVRNKKEWGRYAFFCGAFFLFTFVCGGFLLSLWNGLPNKPPFLCVLVAVCVAVGMAEAFSRSVWKKRKLYACIYDCVIEVDGKKVTARGYLDSGNLAKVDGLPVCFLDPETFYLAFGEQVIGGQRQEKTSIATMSGVREITVYKGELLVKNKQGARTKQVYFSMAKNMLFREYEILLSACMIDEQ